MRCRPGVVAATHDTSVAMIEKHYSKFIADHSDDISRAALLHHDAPTPVAAATVVPIALTKARAETVAIQNASVEQQKVA